MQIAGLNTQSIDTLRDMVSDVLGAPDKSSKINTSNTSFVSQGPINDTEDVGTKIHQLLGNKMTQVNTVV